MAIRRNVIRTQPVARKVFRQPASKPAAPVVSRANSALSDALGKRVAGRVKQVNPRVVPTKRKIVGPLKGSR